MPCIVTLAIVFALPIYYHSELMVLDLGGGNETENSDIEYNNIAYCIENWRFDDDQASDPERRLYYSIFSIFMQYVIPFSIMTTIYGKIFLYLRKHRIVREERPRDRQKARRTNIMLGTVLNNTESKSN